MTDENTPAAAAQESNGPQLALQRFYLKDCSFESPDPVAAFRNMAEWNPELQLNLATSASEISDGVREVVLKVQAEIKQDDKTLYLVEVQQAGLFTIKGFEGEELAAVLGSYCPSLLYPYAREAVSDLVGKGGFPQLLLQPVNFDRLFQKAQEQMAAQAAGNA